VAIKADLALGGRALRQVRRLQVVCLRTCITADVRIDAGLQPHGVQPVGERPEAGTVRTTGGRRRKNAGADLQASVARAALEPPAIVEVDVGIAELGQPAVDQHPRSADDLFFINLRAERVPAVPAHRRGACAAAGTAFPVAGRRQRIGGRLGTDLRDQQRQRGSRDAATQCDFFLCARSGPAMNHANLLFVRVARLTREVPQKKPPRPAGRQRRRQRPLQDSSFR
jgi:hypothetical protein